MSSRTYGGSAVVQFLTPVTLTAPTTKIKSYDRSSSLSATSLMVRTPVVVIGRDVQVRHEARLYRVEVRDLLHRVVAATWLKLGAA
jgi:hypothetical protein